MVIIDFHTHAFPDDLAEHAIATLNGGISDEGAHAVLDGTLSGLLGSMDRAGIDRCVICSIATAPKQVGSILRWSLSIRSERVVPFASVHPDCDGVAGELRRIAEAGILGIKLHPLYQGFAADDGRLWPLYAAIEDLGLILVMHAGLDVAFPFDDERASPGRILAVHEAFPGIPLVAAHMGGWSRWDEVAQTLAGTGVYLETSYAIDRANRDKVMAVVERHAPERMLFGTDSPWRDQSETLDLVKDMFPDAATQRAVLGGNAARLLGGDVRSARGPVTN
jgi:predicted TIM-barrel fold metal-dependent hydrolase